MKFLLLIAHGSRRQSANEEISLLAERVAALETNNFDGVVTAFGLVNGRRVMVASQDAAVMGGSLGEMHANKIVKAMRMAVQCQRPSKWRA